MYEQDPYIKDKFEFQKDNTALKHWTDSVLAPSLLDGKDGVQTCIDSILSEKDQFLKMCKFIYTYRVWDRFEDASAPEVALDLAAQGYTQATLARSLRALLFDEINPDDIKQAKELLAEALDVDPDDLTELVQNHGTLH